MPPKKHGFLFHAFLVMFTIFAIPLIIILPFFLAGFVGRL
jgi:hypothetical protein